MEQLFKEFFNSIEDVEEDSIRTAFDIVNITENRVDPFSDLIRSCTLKYIKDKKIRIDQAIEIMNSSFDITEFPEDLLNIHIDVMSRWQRQSRLCGELLSRLESSDETIP